MAVTIETVLAEGLLDAVAFRVEPLGILTGETS